ncbi:hydroxyquinol 1,2-dioxygenase [Altererythrobacter lauratis]|uniref:Hydroxyquinol 1,2-dioxygenase n=1 Tax=Alteraurantiacibacter lauratis TaxID=2054627 RepID=A0ABV7EJA7_9SPHN
MSVLDAKVERLSTDPATGYTAFRLGSFTFRRDEYFAHVSWPKGSHIIEVDRFLRAMVRDIGWGFFYGWIFFDDIFGTTNHYGTVDIFAGSYDKGYREAGIDHLETFTAEAVSEAFEAISRDWISEGYDPLNAPLETGSPIGPKGPERTDPLLRAFIAADRMLGLPGDKPVRSDETGHPINRAFADLEYDAPEIECAPGFEGQLHAINLFEHIARSDVTWNPSISAVTRANICCVTSEEHMLPVIHGNDRNEWFIQLTDEIHWSIADKETGAPRGRVVMRPGDVCAMPADIRHQGFAPKRAMLMVMENGTPGLEQRYASGELKPYPVDFR